MVLTPLRPGQDVAGRGGHGPHESPPQPPPFGHAQREARPRLALNAASGCATWGGGRLLLHASTAIVPARMTVSRANAHIASVLGRYQAVPLGTSSCSRLTSPLASSQLLSTVQRRPATRTTSCRGVACGA